MDADTRNAIERATQRARTLLQDDFVDQLEGTYDVFRSGHVPPQGGAHLDARRRLERGKLVAAVDHKRAAGMAPPEAVKDVIRDAAFTALNRLIALKMLEVRELVKECISKGEQSSGYSAELCGAAPGLRLLPDGAGYRLYLECIFDELSTEVKVLFDRRDPASILWPRRATLDGLLSILNAPELEGVWREDETLGWVYQFFNAQEERRAMREASSVPRNGRELAVRNQFFTPRYVVEFLTDNTLGRIWYEMRGGNTRLTKTCEYLVRCPSETYPVRPKKDPRALRVLDPACGSGHFLLYAFELLETIYQEAWTHGDSPPLEISGTFLPPLREHYVTPDALNRAIPELILKYNLHGIDIDPRACQITALALWLRVQRSWQRVGLKAADRPRIERTNIACAEPMPGEGETLNGLVAALEQSEHADLVRNVFKEMAIAGELGSLLRIEKEILKAIRSTELYGEDAAWEFAERRLRKEIERCAESATRTSAFATRLFAKDAAGGFAFLDVCRKRYDVVLMNPPFGACSAGAKKGFEKAYPRTKNDLYAAFVERGIELLVPRGRLGAITSRTGFFLSSFQAWREEILLAKAPPVVVADLGAGVLDSAMVETAAYCLEAVA